MRVYNCLHCGKESPKQFSKKNMYCSNSCQGFYQASVKLQRWLDGDLNKGPGRLAREHILKEQKNCCALCGLSPEWEGKELVFVLDHTDGNSENNTRENLRLVCPNCDSQLSTFKNKNKGKGRHTRRQRYTEGKSY